MKGKHGIVRYCESIIQGISMSAAPPVSSISTAVEKLGYFDQIFDSPRVSWKQKGRDVDTDLPWCAVSCPFWFIVSKLYLKNAFFPSSFLDVSENYAAGGGKFWAFSTDLQSGMLSGNSEDPKIFLAPTGARRSPKKIVVFCCFLFVFVFMVKKRSFFVSNQNLAGGNAADSNARINCVRP